MACLPFRNATVDVVVSGLALGHARELERCMREIARVLRPGGTLLYSDFHPEALRRGLRRAFRAVDGARHELPVDGHPVARHLEGLRAAGFDEVDSRELRAGMGFDVDFPGAAAFYETWHGTPLVLTVRARRRIS
jgi:malonyl-CoA O-methyltransferase